MLVVRLAGVLAVAMLASCAVVTADSERLRLTASEFPAYVERVFREQNRLADALAFALEGEQRSAPDLMVAEQQLGMACAGVNELATARRDDRNLGWRRSAQLARSVPECERAARAAAAALGTRNE